MIQAVVYVSGGSAYEAVGNVLIIDFDNLKEAGVPVVARDTLETLVELNKVEEAREYMEYLYQRYEEG